MEREHQSAARRRRAHVELRSTADFSSCAPATIATTAGYTPEWLGIDDVSPAISCIRRNGATMSNQRQARHRHRQRRNRRHHRPGIGAEGKACDHAAAFAELYRQHTREGPDGGAFAGALALQPGVLAHALAANHAADVLLSLGAQQTAKGSRHDSRWRQSCAGTRIRCRAAFQSPLQSLG